MKFLFKALIAFGIVLPCHAVHAQSFHSYETKVHGITYRIDPRIELMNTVFMLFGHNDMTKSNIPYKKELLDHFAAFSRHPVVDSALNSFKSGWGMDDPVFFMLCLDERFRLQEGLVPDQVKRGGGWQRLQKLAELFRDFSVQSNFYSFFNTTQKHFYEEIIRRTAYSFKDFSVTSLLENYFGKKQHEYVVVLNLVGGYGNFGWPVTRGGRTSLHAVVETNQSAGAVPLFQPSVSLFNLILHEFSHSYVNPEVDKYKKQLDQYDWLYMPIQDAMKAQGYAFWQVSVNEHIVRSAVVRMARKYYGIPFTEKTIYKTEIGRRFIYLDALCSQLEVYEKNRDKYPTFARFVPELLTVFSQIRKEDLPRLQEKVENIREPDIEHIPKPSAFARDSTTFFITGTHERDKVAQERVHEFVRRFRDMFSKDIRIITDDAALSMDLKENDLVLFGTVEGNSFLQKHAHLLPVTILEDCILTNKTIRGNDLQIVTSWVNPFNSKKSMVVYTAQRTEDIKNYDYSSVKDQFHYWVARNTITIDKGDYGRYWKVWMPDIFE